MVRIQFIETGGPRKAWDWKMVLSRFSFTAIVQAYQGIDAGLIRNPERVGAQE